VVLNSMSVQQLQIGEAGIDQPRAEPVPPMSAAVRSFFGLATVHAADLPVGQLS